MLAAKFGAILPHLDERQRRPLIGAEAQSLGHGRIRAVARAAGVREATVSAGMRELDSGEGPLGRVRRGPAPAANASPTSTQPSARRWNRIEHRLFSHITMNWRGRPLTSHEVIVESIAATTTKTGLTVHAELDTNPYPTGIQVSDDEIAALPITRHRFHGDRNYTLVRHEAPLDTG